MKQKHVAIFLVILATLLTTTGQYFLKIGATKISDIQHIFNTSLIIGLLIYGFAALLLILSLQRGELSLVYPFIALSFIWVTLVSRFFLQEVISFTQWFGIFAIVFGVSFIGFGGVHD